MFPKGYLQWRYVTLFETTETLRSASEVHTVPLKHWTATYEGPVSLSVHDEVVQDTMNLELSRTGTTVMEAILNLDDAIKEEGWVIV